MQAEHADGPLSGITVLDFTMRLPGPLASLLLAEAGATVIKVESPGGDWMRSAIGAWPDAPAMFATLNRGKRSLCVDLKDASQRSRVTELLGTCDVLLEGFRPGVMERLGFGYESVAALYPRIVYCSITGYGRASDERLRAGHDLSYMAESGLLDLLADESGNPIVPGTLLADIAGGSYPAVMNVLLALIARERTGKGAHIDVAMRDNLAAFGVWAFAKVATTGRWPQRAREILSGGSPRYHMYPTSDGRYLAVAALEDNFWKKFCDVVDLEQSLRNDVANPAETVAGVAARVAHHDAVHWRSVFTTEDCCCAIVDSLEEANAAGRLGDGARTVTYAGATMPALPLPLDPAMMPSAMQRDAPKLGEFSDEEGRT
jgi:crotonobetainyl-CoA:carnitine CoA-transferase CaiB-like acyl-CoA transferase